MTNPNAPAAPSISSTGAPSAAAQSASAPASMDTSGLLDFDSDEPLKACPLRNNGDTSCESCGCWRASRDDGHESCQ